MPIRKLNCSMIDRQNVMHFGTGRASVKQHKKKKSEKDWQETQSSCWTESDTIVEDINLQPLYKHDFEDSLFVATRFIAFVIITKCGETGRYGKCLTFTSSDNVSLKVQKKECFELSLKNIRELVEYYQKLQRLN